MLSWWNLLWCIGGDFNVTCFPSEILGDARFCPAMVGFFDFELGLMDIPLVGGNFTWSNNRDLLSWSRIDRFSLSLDWDAKFPDLSQRRLPRLCSDRFPILLDCGSVHCGRRYFKFENIWLKAEGFVDKVRQWLTSCHFQGSLSFILARKLKALKVDLRV
jgi:hypothetical protein